MRVPDWVPAGTSTLTDFWDSSKSSRSASRVCTGTLVPSAAAVIGIVTTISRLSPSRVKTSCGLIVISMYRSPAGPPPGPTSPCESRWIRLPSATPAGILTLMVRVVRTRPSPEHS